MKGVALIHTLYTVSAPLSGGWGIRSTQQVAVCYHIADDSRGDPVMRP
jgi:hypothetical protein